jgi:uncharacterized membrane-anchored protein
MKVIEQVLSSFKNNKEGFSGRKLSAFAGVFVASYLSFKNTDNNNITWVVGTWLTYSLLCLGIVTVANLIEILKAKDSMNPAPPPAP